MFKLYDNNSTLENEGFQVFNNSAIYFKIMNMLGKNIELEEIGKYVDNKDVFRTKLGDIKQIQNLHYSFELSELLEINSKLAELIGWDEFEVLNNQLFCKPPNYKMTSAHQDNAYFDSDEEVVTFWIPLQDVDLLNSCMFYVPESHKRGLVEHLPIGTNIRTRTGKKGVSLYTDVFKNSEFVQVPMNAGQILVHDKNCVHFSSPNLTDNYRKAFTAILKRVK